MNYAALAFTENIKQFQEEFGSRKTYERVEKKNVTDGLSENEIEFIEYIDHFFMASFGENGYPYIQHRGGPRGFVKTLDNKTLAFVDFSGNKQYISLGNISTNPNVAIIMVSYPHRARLKIYAKAEVVHLEKDASLLAQLKLSDYDYRPERIIKLHIEAFDWNCPQHITPRYTVEELQPTLKKQTLELERLQAENEALKAALNQ